MNQDLKAFYEYHACLMEPWDGPASIVVHQRPDRSARCWTETACARAATTSPRTTWSSWRAKSACCRSRRQDVARKWRLQPGKIFLVDIKQGRIIDDSEIKRRARRQAALEEVASDENLIPLDDLPPRRPTSIRPDHETLLVRQHAFGYTNEDLKLFHHADGRDAVARRIGCDGHRHAAGVSRARSRSCSTTTSKQLFAQVTNPPLDAIREELVTSLYTVHRAAKGTCLEETPEAAPPDQAQAADPAATRDLAKLRASRRRANLRAVTLSMLVQGERGRSGLQPRSTSCCDARPRTRCDEGASILDPLRSRRGHGPRRRSPPCSATRGRASSPGSRDGTRTQCGLVIETGEARESHHFCLLIGYGAGAVNPYLALETIAQTCTRQGRCRRGPDVREGREELHQGREQGPSSRSRPRWASRTLQSYRGAQIFEAIGLQQGAGRPVLHAARQPRIKGIGLDTIAREMR